MTSLKLQTLQIALLALFPVEPLTSFQYTGNTEASTNVSKTEMTAVA